MSENAEQRFEHAIVEFQTEIQAIINRVKTEPKARDTNIGDIQDVKNLTEKLMIAWSELKYILQYVQDSQQDTIDVSLVDQKIKDLNSYRAMLLDEVNREIDKIDKIPQEDLTDEDRVSRGRYKDQDHFVGWIGNKLNPLRDDVSYSKPSRSRDTPPDQAKTQEYLKADVEDIITRVIGKERL